MSSFKFNNERKNYIQIAKGWKRSTWAPLKRNFLSTPGYPGARLLNTQTEMRVLSIPVGIIVPDDTDLEMVKEEIASWLITDQPVELIFDVEPNRTYLAVVDDSFDLDEFVTLGIGTLTFICPMPYKLGPVQKKTLAIANGDLKTSFLNKGSVESNPIIDIKVGAQSPYLDVWNDDEYFRIGYPTGVKTRVVKQNDRLIWDEMTNLTIWEAITGKIGIYKSSGAMKVWQGYAFTPDSYGTGANDEWHGPFMKRTIPNTSGVIQDFKIDVQMNFQSEHWNRMGKTVVMLLDANDNVIVELAMADEYMSHEMTTAQAIIDPGSSRKWIADEMGMYSDTFNDFRGHVSVARRGKEWSFYFAKYRKNTEIDDASFVRTWRDNSDSNPMTARPVAKIAVGCIAYGANPPVDVAFIEDVKFWKINTLTIDETPYIFDIGDKIQIDTERSLVTINGTNAIALKDIFSSFPVIKRGQNAVIIRPANVGIAELTYRERFR
ncbi:distal tail protein Dit [Bacillus thuringiensis]|uniref:Phage tail protein n=1 Tax=Bacillus thuringiensis Bt18247 TaxID=1423143 RepID=A0A9W3SQA1_BACTU|nr:distal tail protein Dit [Bacillus thuringiensis]AOM09685.1 Phage tail protein [Bacillus thuringiensis Bt18247]MBG9529150.1 phage tail protein [Bacillus thuringiensis]